MYNRNVIYGGFDMSELLTQAEGDALIAISKEARSSEIIKFPSLGGKIELELISEDKKEEFVLNYTRYSINLSKRNHHLRTRKAIGLVRLDLDGPPHRNPDGEEIGSRHLHLYKEGYGMKWAVSIPEDAFKNLDNAYDTLSDFMIYCNIISFPSISKDLFS